MFIVPVTWVPQEVPSEIVQGKTQIYVLQFQYIIYTGLISLEHIAFVFAA